jgi:hypothetical protein
MARYQAMSYSSLNNDQPLPTAESSSRYQAVPYQTLTGEEKKEPSYPAEKYGMGGVYKSREAPETILPEHVAQVARGVGSIASGALGFPGDVAKLAASGVDWVTKNLGSHKGLLKDTVKTEGTRLADYVPDVLTSQGIKEKLVKPLLKSQAEPTSEREAKVQDFLELAGSFVFPEVAFAKAGKLMKAGKATLTAAAASGAKEIAKEFLPKNKANGIIPEFASTGGMLAASIWLNRGKLPSNVMQTLYDDSKAALKSSKVKGFKLSSTQGKRAMEQVELAKKALPTGGENALLFEAIEKAAKKGKGTISAEHLVDVKKALNKEYGHLYKKGLSTNYIGDLVDDIKGSLNTYGKAYNRPFLESLTKADEMFGAIKGAKSIADFSKELVPYLGKIKIHPLAGALISSYGALKTVSNPFLMAGAAGGLAVNTVLKGAQAAFKSPNVRKAYGEFLMAVASQNKASGIKAVTRLNNAIKNSEGAEVFSDQLYDLPSYDNKSSIDTSVEEN